MSSLIDYVVVCGSPSDPSETIYLPQLPVSRYIVDVAIIFPDKNEEIPSGYERIRLSPKGHEIDLNIGKFWRTKIWIAVKYNWNEPTDISLPNTSTCQHDDLPISSIACYAGHKDAKIQDGWQKITETVTGRDANINTGSGSSIYLIYKRIDSNGEPSKTPILTHLTVIDTYYEEVCPVGYLTIDLNINHGSSGHVIRFCTKTVPFLSATKRIGPVLLERYPRSDPKKSKLQLPPSIEQFCMPLGVQSEHFQHSHQVPLPEWHPFVLTEGDGVKLFGAALMFWELCNDPKERQEKLSLLKSGETTHSCARLLELASGLGGGRTRRKRGINTKQENDSSVYRTKCIAILSHFPFFQGFKKALKLLYRVAMGGQSIVPIERYISNLVLSVPLPSPGTNVVLDWGLGDSNAIIFRRPEREDLPILGVSFLPMFHMLSINTIVRVWSLILLERKIIFHSRDVDVITPILEALRVLIFPLKYTGIYIPMCATHIMRMLLQAPVPHCIGVASEGIDRIDIPDGTWCVDIDNDRVGLTVRGYPSKTAGYGVDFLPVDIFNTFTKGLRNVCKEADVFRDGIAEVSDVFQTSQSAAMAANQGIDEDKVRDLALRCMITLLNGYDRYLVINNEFVQNNQRDDTATTNSYGIEAVFRLSDFIADKLPNHQEFLIQLGETQSFAYMMNERTYPGQNDLSFVFFDHCSNMWQKEIDLENKAIDLLQLNSSSNRNIQKKQLRQKLKNKETLRNQVLNMTKKYNRRSSITLPRTRSGQYTKLRPAHGSSSSMKRIASLKSMNHPLSGLMDFEANEDDVATDVMEWCRAREMTRQNNTKDTDDGNIQFQESLDGTMVLVSGPSKLHLEKDKIWITTTDFALQDALFEPTTIDSITGRIVSLTSLSNLRSVTVSVDETLPARSRYEKDDDHVTASEMYGGGNDDQYYLNVSNDVKLTQQGQQSASFHLKHLFGCWSMLTSVRMALMLEKGVDPTLCRGLAHTSITTMLYIESLLSGQPLDEASYRAVLTGCNLSKLRYDIGASFVEDGLNRIERQANALTDGQIAIARQIELKANSSENASGRNGRNGRSGRINRMSTTENAPWHVPTKPWSGGSERKRHSVVAIDRFLQSNKLWEKHGIQKPLICMWAVLEEEKKDDSEEHKRFVPESHILVGVCAKVPSNNVQRELQKRTQKICYLAEGSVLSSSSPKVSNRKKKTQQSLNARKKEISSQKSLNPRRQPIVRKKEISLQRFKKAARSTIRSRRPSTQHQVSLSHVIEIMQRRTSVMFHPTATIGLDGATNNHLLSMINEGEGEDEEETNENDQEDQKEQEDNDDEEKETKTSTTNTTQNKAPRSQSSQSSQSPHSPHSPQSPQCQISSPGDNMLQIKSVDYLSPHELRNDLEVILGMHGRKGLSKQNIKTNYPVLFYNLVWYCTRMKMNFPLFEMESERNCESNERNDFSNVMNEIEEQVLLGPHEAWARDTINKRRAFVAEKGKMVLQAVMSNHSLKKSSEEVMIQSASKKFRQEPPPSYSMLPTTFHASAIDNNRNNDDDDDKNTSEQKTRLMLNELQQMITSGNVDEALVKMLRSQHLYLPELHKHTIYSLLRHSAFTSNQTDVLLGCGPSTSSLRMPSPVLAYQVTPFDHLYHLAYLKLSPQMRSESLGLHQSGGIFMTDRQVGIFRHVFGDIFHGIHEGNDSDSSEEEEEDVVVEEDVARFPKTYFPEEEREDIS